MVAYADKLRASAMRLLDPSSPHHDPYARPYYPTTAAARKLCQRKSNELAAQLPPDATPEQIEEARARGPQAALEEMAWRAAQAERRRREDQAATHRADSRLWRTQRRARLERQRQREHLTLGLRLDIALAALAAIPAAPAARAFDAKVHGGESQGIPRFPGDPAAKARAIARDAVEKVEDELETARRRRLELGDRPQERAA